MPEDGEWGKWRARERFRERKILGVKSSFLLHLLVCTKQTVKLKRGLGKLPQQEQTETLVFNLKLRCKNKNIKKLHLTRQQQTGLNSATEDMLTLTCCQDHILTENIWFVCSETLYSGDERRCDGCGTNDQTITEHRATQPTEAEG